MSYSHAADGRFAPALQSALQRFAKPFYRLRALSIFRDQTTLHLTAALWPDIQRAIASSQYFILLASPDAAGSLWVSQEIGEWLRLHDDSLDRFLIVVTDGTVEWDDEAGDFDWGRSDALPQVLRGKFEHEPLYLDMRWARSSTDLSLRNPRFLDDVGTISATLHGVPKNVLVGQDVSAHRTFRRVTVAVGVALVLLTTWAVVSWRDAVEQRRVADRRRVMAEVAQLDALASQQFAEARRAEAQRDAERGRLTQLVEERALIERRDRGNGDSRALRVQTLASEVTQTTAAIGRLRAGAQNYRSEGRALLMQADSLWASLRADGDGVVERPERPAPPTAFSLEIMSAAHGECMLLHYGDPDRPALVLIGGGPKAAFKRALEPRLDSLRKLRDNTRPLVINLAIGSHPDEQSIDGLAALTDALVADQRGGRTSAYRVETLWYNSFEPLDPRSVKTRLTLNAQELGIEHNAPFGTFVLRPDSGAVRVVRDGLTITVVGPSRRRLQALAEYWRNRARVRGLPLVPAPTVHEAFNNPAIHHVRPPVATPHIPDSASYRDQSVANLASIAVVFELAGRRLLYAGDAIGSDIIEGLYAAGILSAAGTAHMDLMVVPHFGSDQNVSTDFFRRITADHYVLLGDGTHRNPEVGTLEMIAEARADADLTLYFADRDGRENHGTKLDEYFLRTPALGARHRRVFRRSDASSLLIDFGEPVRY